MLYYFTLCFSFPVTVGKIPSSYNFSSQIYKSGNYIANFAIE